MWVVKHDWQFECWPKGNYTILNQTKGSLVRGLLNVLSLPSASPIVYKLRQLNVGGALDV